MRLTLQFSHYSVGVGHPRVSKAAVFDIITTDLATGGSAAIAEAIIVMQECLNSFPNLAQHYELHISHSKSKLHAYPSDNVQVSLVFHTVIDIAVNRIPESKRSAVLEILTQTRSSWSQKRSALLKTGLARSMVDELEVLNDTGTSLPLVFATVANDLGIITDEDMDALLARLEKISPHLHALISLSADEIKVATQYANAAGVQRTIIFHPMMLNDRSSLFKDGIYFEVVRRNKHNDVLATCGRYAPSLRLSYL